MIGGDGVSFVDGSEDRVLGILESAGNRTATSDELARQADDWPTTYHLSPLRANLLLPLDIGAGRRVLDVGAGTGVLARHLAETGSSVVALEGSFDRATSAAVRCDGLDNVEVLCGPIEALDDADGFDVVLCVGVLEYARRPDELLQTLRRLTRPGGALVLAIENQLGLKYLLGYGEDHLGEPWTGVQGYRPDGPRTFSRRRLARMLGGAGFPEQRWLFPFPDYKLPTSIVTEAAYAMADGPRFVDQIVRWPCSSEASAPARLCDDRRAHRELLDAGLGPDVANSFLVVAGGDPAAPDGLLREDVVAWHFGGKGRSRLWVRSKAFAREAASPVRTEHRIDDGRLRQRGWLGQVDGQAEPRAVGPTIEQLALDACLQGRDEVGVVLGRWRGHLSGLEMPAADDPDGRSHPFRSDVSKRLLPPDHLDITLSNFVVGDDGGIHFVDREWTACSGVDSELVRLRALWWFASDLVLRGVDHPWPLSCTVNELAEILGLLCDTPADADAVDRFLRAEALLQAKVSDRPADELLDGLVKMGDVTALVMNRHLPFTTLRRRLADQAARLASERERAASLAAELDAERGRAAELATELDAQRARADSLAGELTAERQRAEGLVRELDAHVARWQALERRAAVRLYRAARRALGAGR